MQEEPIFYERQRIFRWLKILIIIFANAAFIYGCIIQLVMGKAWGDDPMSNTMLIIVTALVLLLTVTIFFIHIDTIINEEGIYIRIFPFFFRSKFFSWDIISKAYIRKYNPILEYGGWGMRKKFRVHFHLFRRKGIHIRGIRNSNVAYTMSGNIGLQLELTDGKLVLIGTRMPDEMEGVLRKLGKWEA